MKNWIRSEEAYDTLSTRTVNSLFAGGGPPDCYEWTEDEWKEYVRRSGLTEFERMPNIGRKTVREIADWAGLPYAHTKSGSDKFRTKGIDLPMPVGGLPAYVSRYPEPERIAEIDREIALAKKNLSELWERKRLLTQGWRPLQKIYEDEEKFFKIAKVGFSASDIARTKSTSITTVRRKVRNFALASAERIIGPCPTKEAFPNERALWTEALAIEAKAILDQLPVDFFGAPATKAFPEPLP